jgi:hypothetical protein
MPSPVDENFEIKDSWFVPSFPPREDSPHEVAMLTSWKEMMIYQNYFNLGWETRLESVLIKIPGGAQERASCVATSFALWLSMPVGHSFINALFSSFRKKDPLWEKTEAAVKAWAVENMLGKNISNLLSRIINERKDYFGKVTHEDHRAIEATLSWFMSDEGSKFYEDVMRVLYPDYIIPELKTKS